MRQCARRSAESRNVIPKLHAHRSYVRTVYVRNRCAYLGVYNVSVAGTCIGPTHLQRNTLLTCIEQVTHNLFIPVQRAMRQVLGSRFAVIVCVGSI